MKHFSQIVFLFLAFISFSVKGQNLVKNPSFEDNLKCPEKFGTLDVDAKNWHKPTLGTTDYFSTCSTELPVQNNFIGSQKPYHGTAYAGMYLYAPKDYREYITAELTEPLEKDKLYKVSFMVNLAENVAFSVKEFDVLFTKSKLSLNTSKNLDVRYFNGSSNINYKKIPLKNYLTDSEEWVEVSTTIMAKGNESYLTLGNFNCDKNTFKQEVKKASRKSAYYFIDMVSVSMIPSYNQDQLYVIDDLFFDFDETNIEINYNQQLADLVLFLKNNPKLNIHLYGHTDAMGGKEYNEDLSNKRAATVAKFLIKSGLKKNRITWKGFGFKKPVVSNDEQDLRSKNRRVEFMISKPNSNYANTYYEE
ncbi:OmpA family protein [Cellulophaga baltica]|uniref:OmpA family protein n=1 Tax=Cellulophaga TaxID=104264 RepID=UPI001C066288|nr:MULTISPECIES: OmpA family protein [Cellulophaga]MBU2996987.1 OmpA family protein [Cellulophaga baltica]MDO6768385.1 OmpA family protein [Cellulophaga sp. 1_MG-2023]